MTTTAILQASAADLKFLQRLPQARSGTSNRQAALDHKLVSAPLLPKFVSEGAATYHELRKRGTNAEPLTPRIISLFGQVSQVVRAWRNRAAAATLHQFDDHRLADIGITRSDLRNAFAEPIWRDPTGFLGDRAVARRRGAPTPRARL